MIEMNVRRILMTPDVLTLMDPYRPPPIGGTTASTFRTRLQRLLSCLADWRDCRDCRRWKDKPDISESRNWRK